MGVKKIVDLGMLGRRFEELPPDEQDEMLAGALDRLAQKDDLLAETLLRAVYFEEPYGEIARSMNVTKGAVSKRRKRALACIRVFLDEALDEAKTQ